MLTYCVGCTSDPNPPGPAPSLLDWKTVHRDMQWGVILLLGGGFAIADACKVNFAWWSLSVTCGFLLVNSFIKLVEHL